MKTQFIHISTEDKLRLDGNIYNPDMPTKKAIFHIHGMGGNFYENHFLDFMATTFTTAGYTFLSINNRGAGYIFDFFIEGEKEATRRIGNAYEKFEESMYDIRAGIDSLVTQGYTDIILQGHSLGSVKAAYYMAQTKDPRISKLILISPSDMVGLAEADKNHQEYSDLAKKMVTEGNGNELIPLLLWNWYRLSANTYLNLCSRDAAVDVFNTYNKTAPSCINEIRIPTFAILGGTDDATILPVAEALAVIKAKATSASRFDTTIIGQAPHSYFGYEQELADTIMQWVTAN